MCIRDRPQDYKLAFKWFTKAAEQGYASAQFNLGSMYNQGDGVPQDDKMAFKWYAKAAEQGYVNAQLNLGDMYRDGVGVPNDDKMAFKWYTKAAEQGYADAQFELGEMYGLGRGVPQDYIKAHMWSNVYLQNNALIFRVVAKNNIKKFEKQMTPEQITKARKLASQCYTKKFKGC